MTSDEQIAWVAWVAWLFRGIVFWRWGQQALILPGHLWRQGPVS